MKRKPCTVCRARQNDLRNGGLCSTCGMRARRAVCWLLYYGDGLNFVQIAALLKVTSTLVRERVMTADHIVRDRLEKARGSREPWARRLHAVNAIPPRDDPWAHWRNNEIRVPLETTR